MELKNLINKLVPLIRIQANMIGINLNGGLVNYQKPLDIPSFVDFLLEDKKSKTKVKYSSENLSINPIKDFNMQSSYGMQNLYETTNGKPNVYKFENGKSKLISGTENKQSPREYLTQKLIAIQSLKNQIDSGSN